MLTSIGRARSIYNYTTAYLIQQSQHSYDEGDLEQQKFAPGAARWGRLLRRVVMMKTATIPVGLAHGWPCNTCKVSTMMTAVKIWGRQARIRRKKALDYGLARVTCEAACHCYCTSAVEPNLVTLRLVLLCWGNMQFSLSYVTISHMILLSLVMSFSWVWIGVN